MNAADLQARLGRAHRLMMQGDLAAATAVLEETLRIMPRDPNTLHMLAAVKQRAGDQAQALGLFDDATRLAPAAAPFHFNRANLLLEMGRNADAIDGYDAALALRPQHAESWRNRARALREVGRADEALTSCNKALRLAPGDPTAQYERGLALFALRRLTDAAAAFEVAAEARPNNADFHFNRGRSLQELGRLEEALTAYDHAAALDPQNAGIQHNRAVLLYWLGRRDAAIAAFDASLAQRPAHVETLYTKGIAHLAFGELAEGWPLHALRREPGSPIAIEDLSRGEPAWNGERVSVLRLWREQGVGDEVLFARLAHLTRASADRVVLECGERLVPLFARSFPEFQVCAIGQAPRADAQCAIGSVGQFLAPDISALGAGAPYLRADDRRAAALRARYSTHARGRPIVGIAWASNNPRLGSHKSAALSEWGAVLNRDCSFVSLQYGDVVADIDAAQSQFGADIFVDPEVDQLASVDDFAAQVAAMDAIVSISNTTVHVAGALGLPCIAIVPPAQGLLWYWGAAGETTPWYQSVRLARRTSGEGWAEQVTRAGKMLERLLF
jgi:tetratricopeptide (TPR) repeat protein